MKQIITLIGDTAGAIKFILLTGASGFPKLLNVIKDKEKFDYCTYLFG